MLVVDDVDVDIDVDVSVILECLLYCTGLSKRVIQ
jgi:hypothetical protein